MGIWMTTIYGSDGQSRGRSSGNTAPPAKKAKVVPKQAPVLKETKTEPQIVADGDIVAAAPVVIEEPARPRKLRARPIDVRKLKIESERVKEMRERMQRLRASAAQDADE